jgi:hypothetical protein
MATTTQIGIAPVGTAGTGIRVALEPPDRGELELGARPLWLALAVLAALGSSSCAPPPSAVVVFPDGLCWPPEGPAAHDEYVARCRADGAQCLVTTDWRARLRLLAVQLEPCASEPLGDPSGRCASRRCFRTRVKGVLSL